MQICNRCKTTLYKAYGIRKHKSKCAVSTEIDKYVCKDCNTKCSFRQSYERHRKYNCKLLNV